MRTAVAAILTRDRRFADCAEAADAPGAGRAAGARGPEARALHVRQPGGGAGSVGAILTRDGRFAVCAEAADAAGAVEAAVREQPELCLLDVRMPGGGVAAAWEIAARLPQTRIVMFTVSEDDGDVRSALHAGVAG